MVFCFYFVFVDNGSGYVQAPSSNILELLCGWVSRQFTVPPRPIPHGTLWNPFPVSPLFSALWCPELPVLFHSPSKSKGVSLALHFSVAALREWISLHQMHGFCRLPQATEGFTRSAWKGQKHTNSPSCGYPVPYTHMHTHIPLSQAL